MFRFSSDLDALEGNNLIGDIILDAASHLKRAGLDSWSLDARCLMGHVLRKDPASLIGSLDEPMGSDSRAFFYSLLARRLEREPISRIIGSREFWSLSFDLTEDVLDPRPDSETLVEAVLSEIKNRHDALKLLDLGIGSGCLLSALLSEMPEAHGIGLDNDYRALIVAQRNLNSHNFGHRATLVCGDWCEALSYKFDVIVSNPPYLASSSQSALAPEVIYHDPPHALFAGKDGLDSYRRIIPSLPELLRPGGVAVFEVGENQFDLVESLVREIGFYSIICYKDLAGIQRCLVVRAPT